jgi:hypothetical protein
VELSKTITAWRDVTSNLNLVNRCLDSGSLIDGLRYNTDVAVSQGKVFAAFSGDEIVGGYVLIHKPPFRILTLTDFFRGDNYYSQTVDQRQIVEIGAVWLHPDITSSRESIKIWVSIAINVLKLRRREVIYGINLDRTGLVKRYHDMNPEIMWQGDTTTFNIKTHPRLTLEKAKTKYLLKKILSEAMKRLIKPSVRGITRISQANKKAK